MLVKKEIDVELNKTGTTEINPNNTLKLLSAEEAVFYCSEHDLVTQAETDDTPELSWQQTKEDVLTIRKVNNWYKSLTSLDNPGCGVDDFLEKHDLLYAVNDTGEGNINVNDYLAQGELDCDIDLGNQLPSKALYLQGCLLHEAALLERHVPTQEWLLRQARNVYMRVNESDSQLGKFQLQEAVRHVYDVEFKLLSNRFRTVFDSEPFDEDSCMALVERYEWLQRQYVEEFYYWCGTDVEGREKSHAGILFEWVTVLAYRHKIWRDFAFADKEIRLALPREDQPTGSSRRRKKQPKKAVDAIIYKYQPDGETEVEYLQCKISKKSQEYLPKITMTKAVNSLSFRRIINSKKGQQKMQALQKSFQETARAIAHEYDNSASACEAESITQLQQIISRSGQAA